MKTAVFFSLLIIRLINCQFAFGQERPEWITNPPPSTLCKKYFVGDGEGRTVTDSKDEAYNDINRQVAESVRVKISIDKQRDLNVVINNKVISQDEKIKNITKIVGEGIVRGLHRLTTHEEEDHTGTFRVWFLYELESGDDECMPRQAKARALVPSWGQFYKRQLPKGIVILSGAVGLGGFAGFSQTQANYYHRLALTSRSNSLTYAEYLSLEESWQTVRNVSIGALIALYLYNVVDAVATKGQPMHAHNSRPFDLQPFYTSTYSGARLIVHLKR